MSTADTDTARVRRPMIQTNVDRDLLNAIDRAAARTRLTRTAWLIQAALSALPDDLHDALNRDRD